MNERRQGYYVRVEGSSDPLLPCFSSEVPRTLDVQQIGDDFWGVIVSFDPPINGGQPVAVVRPASLFRTR